MPTGAAATVWHVEATDPPECGRVAEVLAMTAPGDTIQLGPGRYFENLFLPHSLTLIGAGRDLTVMEPCNGEGSIVRSDWQTERVRVEAIGFENGTGTVVTFDDRTAGGALLLQDDPEAIQILDCRFEENSADIGAAICAQPDTLDVIGCLFRDSDDTGIFAGNGLFVSVESCEFQWRFYPVLITSNADSTIVRNSVFLADTFLDGYHALELDGFNIVVEDCLFWDFGEGRCASAVRLEPYDWAGRPGSVRVARTVLGAGTYVESDSEITAAPQNGGPVDIERVTIVNQNAWFVGEPARFRNSIVRSGRVRLDGPQGSDGSCNVLWDVDLENVGFDLGSTRFEDPLLCDILTGNVNVQPASPCRPENSGGCGWIGAWEGDCGVTPVLVAGMAAELVERDIFISWEWTGIEPGVAWELVRKVESAGGGPGAGTGPGTDTDERVVANGIVYALGREEAWDREAGGSAAGGLVSYELRVASSPGDWDTIAGTNIEVPPLGSSRLVLGATVVSRALTLALAAGEEARVVDVSGRLRAVVTGAESGTVEWDLHDRTGPRLESGVFWVSAGGRSERFVVVKRE